MVKKVKVDQDFEATAAEEYPQGLIDEERAKFDVIELDAKNIIEKLKRENTSLHRFACRLEGKFPNLVPEKADNNLNSLVIEAENWRSYNNDLRNRIRGNLMDAESKIAELNDD